MIMIVCVDDNFGMMFNKRRQSRDKKLCEHILFLSSLSFVSGSVRSAQCLVYFLSIGTISYNVCRV